jgi:hypothetical protein
VLHHGASYLQEVLQLGAVAGNALRLPFQQASMHSPAAGTAAARSHSYHGSRDDEDNSSKKDAAASKRGRRGSSSNADQPSSSGSQATEQLKALQEAIEQATEAMHTGQQPAREASSLPDHIARHAMRDPLGMLMTSRGVPLGISLKVNPDRLMRQQQAAQSER